MTNGQEVLFSCLLYKSDINFTIITAVSIAAGVAKPVYNSLTSLTGCLETCFGKKLYPV